MVLLESEPCSNSSSNSSSSIVVVVVVVLSLFQRRFVQFVYKNTLLHSSAYQMGRFLAARGFIVRDCGAVLSHLLITHTMYCTQ